MKRKLVFNNFLEFDKEDRWLNEMSAKGLAMVRWFPYIYVFEHTEPGAWTYQSGMLPKASGKRYLNFIADAGVETVAAFAGWAIFRKPAAEGPFELFSDTESRIAHYRSVRKRLVVTSWAFVLGAVVYSLGGLWLNSLEPDAMTVWAISLFLLFTTPITAMVIATAVRVTKVIQTLEAERRFAG